MPSTKNTKKESKKWLKLSITKPYTMLAIVFVVLFGGIGVWRLNDSHAASYPCSNEIHAGSSFEEGSTGTCVVYLQRMLNGVRAYAGAAGGGSGRDIYFDHSTFLSTDGDFGPLTEASVKAFQTFTRISSDGIVGPTTWGNICFDTGGGIASGDIDWMVEAQTAYPAVAKVASQANALACNP